jgi:hypothetical protein
MIPQNFYTIINIIFTVIFSFEVIIKLIGLQLKSFLKNPYNVLDLIATIILIIDLSIYDIGHAFYFTALRSFRLFRLFKFFHVEELTILIDSITFTLKTIGNYVILLLIFIYVNALLGMNFYAG